MLGFSIKTGPIECEHICVCFCVCRHVCVCVCMHIYRFIISYDYEGQNPMICSPQAGETGKPVVCLGTRLKNEEPRAPTSEGRRRRMFQLRKSQFILCLPFFFPTWAPKGWTISVHMDKGGLLYSAY